jgi:cytochrome c553
VNGIALAYDALAVFIGTSLMAATVWAVATLHAYRRRKRRAALMQVHIAQVSEDFLRELDEWAQ